MAVVLEEVAAGEDSFRGRFSWSATFAGAVTGAAVTLFLLLLGVGIGLTLIQAPETASTTTFLTLGAIYFVAAQAMGFAVAGHIVGRLIGPMAETDREEEFRAAAHGLAAWGLCVTAMVFAMLLSTWIPAGSSLVADQMRLGRTGGGPSASVAIAYWTDVLFRPAPTPMHASLSWRRYAQADTSGTDASPSPDDEAPAANQVTPMTPTAPAKTEPSPPVNAAAGASSSESQLPAPHVITIPPESGPTTVPAAAGAPASQAENLAAAKAEASHVLENWKVSSGPLPPGDRERLTQIVSTGTGLSALEAARRVDNMQTSIRRDNSQRAEMARRIARNASLWIAFSLLFGAVVATMAAISARWEDDRITFGWRNRSEPA